MGGECMFGKCAICGEEKQLIRTTFYYPIDCDSRFSGCETKSGRNIFFKGVDHCLDCTPVPETTVEVPIKQSNGACYRGTFTFKMDTIKTNRSEIE